MLEDVSGVDEKQILYSEKSKLKGEYSQFRLEPLSEKIPEQTFQSLLNEVRTTDKLKYFESINLRDAVVRLYEEGKPFERFEIRLADKMWGKNLANTLQAVGEAVEKSPNKWIDLLQAPRAISASGDLSRLLRQNITVIGKPKQLLKAFARDYATVLRNDPERALMMEKEYLTSEEGQAGTKFGVRWNMWGDLAGFLTAAENYASTVARKIPGLKRFEMAFAFGGNMLRADLWTEIYRQNKNKGLSEKQWKSLAHVVNILTGEGDPRAFGKFAPFLNATFFAPRLLEARVRSVTDIFNPKISKIARQYLAWQMVKFVAINTAVLGLMSQVPGVNVERDPRSTDFGKIRIGKTRIDFWGGYLPLARTIVRLMAGKVKTQAGEIVDTEVLDTLVSFLQSKLGPIPAAGLDIASGKTFIGEPVDWRNSEDMAREFYQRMTPFFLQDVVDAIRFQGVGKGLLVAPLAFSGAGISTYDPSPSAELSSFRNKISQEITGKKWIDLGPDLQNYLREVMPEIEYKEREIRFEYSKKERTFDILREQKASSKRLKKALPKDVQEEFDHLKISQGYGITRTIGRWKMSQSRYKAYEDGVRRAYKTILPKLIRSRKWETLPDRYKYEILNSVFKDIKSGIRRQIIAQATMEDVRALNERRKAG